VASGPFLFPAPNSLLNAVVRPLQLQYVYLNQNGGFNMRKATKSLGRLIDTMELAAKLNCHPMTIPRYVKIKKGFPKPIKPFGKNLWDERVVEAYLAKIMKARGA
jgi:hypothetical protein